MPALRRGSAFASEARRVGFVAEEVDIAAFLRVDDFALDVGDIDCRPIAPSSGDWTTLRLYVFRRQFPDLTLEDS